MAMTGFATVASVNVAPAQWPESWLRETVEHGEGTFTGVRSARLYAQWWRPARTPRAAVVVVHGLKDHSARYGGLAEALAARGFAVHAFDLRGHGRSDGARGWVDAFDDYVADLETLAGRVRWREARAPLFVVGHGMGGTIATLWALRRTAPLAGLVLSGATLPVCAERPRALAVRALAVVAPRVGALAIDLRRTSRDRRTVEDALRDGLVDHGLVPARTVRELLDAAARIDARTPEVDWPLLAMHGEADAMSNPTGSRRLVDRAASVDKRLYLYEELAHDLLHEPERDVVIGDLGDWLCERAPR
jgi:alpha-beta hydrolase superfamily lysophospholipase